MGKGRHQTRKQPIDPGIPVNGQGFHTHHTQGENIVQIVVKMFIRSWRIYCPVCDNYVRPVNKRLWDI